MDSRYRFAANMPQRYDSIPPSMNSSSSTSNLRSLPNRSISSSNRSFHQAPLIFPQHHQQRLRSSPLFTSSYLGPLQQHRPRFLSAWNLAPSPLFYQSSRNLASNTPTPSASVSKKYEQGSCILNSCASL